MRRIAVLDAPSNLGLRPPTETSVPGCAKAPGALRDHGLLARLGARDAGCLTPPRYDPGDWRPGDGVCHAPAIAAYSRALADRIGAIIDLGEFPVVLGGDCSIVLGSALAMHRLGEAVGGRIGLVFVDGHSDFRHPGNASYVGAAAGEDLALATGRGQADLAAMEGRRPYYRDIDVVVMGIRGHDEYRLDLQAAGIVTRPVPTLRAEGAARSAQWARDQLVDCAGYWVHVDVDVLDPAVMPAVDAPEPGGIAFAELELLLAGLVDTPHCLGVEITVFDPDYDTDGTYAEEITSTLVAGLAPVSTSDAPTPTDRTQVRARDDADAAAEVAAAAASTPPSVVRPVPSVVPAASPEVPAAREGGLGARDGRIEELAARPSAADRPDHGGLRLAGLLGGGRDSGRNEGRSEGWNDSDRSDAGARAGGVRPGGVRSGGLLRDVTRDGGLRAGGLGSVDRLSAVDASPGVLAFPAGLLGGLNRRPAPDAAVSAPSAEPELSEERVPESEGASSHEAEPDDGPTSDQRPESDHGAAPGYGDASATEPDRAEEIAPVHEFEPAVDAESGDEAAPTDAGTTESDAVEANAPVLDDAAEPDEWVDEFADLDDDDEHRHEHPAERPLGATPLLDSAPLPATMPGMLRPRPTDAFTLPAQRPAFDAGPEHPADPA